MAQTTTSSTTSPRPGDLPLRMMEVSVGPIARMVPRVPVTAPETGRSRPVTVPADTFLIPRTLTCLSPDRTSLKEQLRTYPKSLRGEKKCPQLPSFGSHL